MEFLIEFLIEVFGEIIINVIGFLISSFFDTVHSNSKIRKTIKNFNRPYDILLHRIM